MNITLREARFFTKRVHTSSYIYMKLKKTNLVYSDRKQMSSFLGPGVGGGLTGKGHRELLGVMEMF